MAQLALVLQPLSVLAQEKGAAPFNPAAQAQLQRLGQWSQDMEKAKAQSAKANASPADQVSEHLKRAHELIKGLSSTGVYNEKFNFNSNGVTEVTIPENRLIPNFVFGDGLGRLYIGDWAPAIENVQLCQ